MNLPDQDEPATVDPVRISPNLRALFHVAADLYVEETGRPDWWPDDYATTRCVEILDLVEREFLAALHARWPDPRR